MDADQALAMLREAAAELGERLRGGALPKAARGPARALLTRVYEAVEGPLPAAVSLGLLREVDGLAHPLPPWSPASLRARIGATWIRGAVDTALVTRITSYGEMAERVSARIDAFLEATGAEPLRLFVAEVRQGEREPAELEFTRG